MAENELNRAQSGSDEDASNSSGVRAADGELCVQLHMFVLCCTRPVYLHIHLHICVTMETVS